MIVSEKVGINRIVSGTWKHLVFNFLTCLVTYFIAFFGIIPYLEIPVLIPSVLGTALAFFIGFNNNQAYDRWWEARKIWQAIVNGSRTWSRQLIFFPNYDSKGKDVKQIIKKLTYRHIAFLYALKQMLRNSEEDEYLKYINADDEKYISNHSNKANALLNLQTKDLDELYSLEIIDGFRFAEFNKLLINFCDDMGKSERIQNTVFPTTYNLYTKFFIWIFIIFITLVTAQSMDFWSVLAGTLVGYIFLTIHKIGQTLLNPFDEILSGVPLNHIVRTVEIDLLESLNEDDIPEPVQSIKSGYIM